MQTGLRLYAASPYTTDGIANSTKYSLGYLGGVTGETSPYKAGIRPAFARIIAPHPWPQTLSLASEALSPKARSWRNRGQRADAHSLKSVPAAYYSAAGVNAHARYDGHHGAAA